jgi:hypothetical protein
VLSGFQVASNSTGMVHSEQMLDVGGSLDLLGDEQLAFATRDAALRALGKIIAMPIVERRDLNLDEEYLVKIDVRLDVEGLPLPMRPMAYLKRDWSISSEEPWEWRLRP